MPGLLGKKLGMTSVYTADGQVVPVTVIETGPCSVLAVRTKEKDGYDALQLGFGLKKEKHLRKPEKGFYEKVKLTPAAVLREFKNFDTAQYKVGDTISVDIFTVGDKVKVTGKSKGKGFQGVMRRHGFGGVGGTTHGQSDRLRAPGSIGSSSYPSRVFKGTRMAGRTGNQSTTIAGSKVVKVIPEKNLLLVKGAVPGSVNSIVEIKK
ncbi:MAG: 50S ribosomal protein L3 [Melioribacteraceae bacterium]|nr:50S ribosomal protein L3 [Melioribacteraceae bacterium]